MCVTCVFTVVSPMNSVRPISAPRSKASNWSRETVAVRLRWHGGGSPWDRMTMIVPAGSGCAQTLGDRHRVSRAGHPPADARLILQNIGKPRGTEAGDEAVDADLQLLAVADLRAESDQDSAVPDLPAAASGLNHRSPIGDEDDMRHSCQRGRHLALGLRRDRRASRMSSHGV